MFLQPLHHAAPCTPCHLQGGEQGQADSGYPPHLWRCLFRFLGFLSHLYFNNGAMELYVIEEECLGWAFRFNNGTMEFSAIEQNASITEPWSFTLLKK